jgi:hypothetical protein
MRVNGRETHWSLHRAISAAFQSACALMFLPWTLPNRPWLLPVKYDCTTPSLHHTTVMHACLTKPLKVLDSFCLSGSPHQGVAHHF